MYKKIKTGKLKFVILSLITFLGVETIARMYDWYSLFPYYDLFSHFLFGMTFYGLYWLEFRTRKDSKTQFLKKASIKYLIVALFWEWLETIGDTIFLNTDSLKDIFIWDGVTDVIVGAIGMYFAYKYLEYKL